MEPFKAVDFSLEEKPWLTLTQCYLWLHVQGCRVAFKVIHKQSLLTASLFANLTSCPLLCVCVSIPVFEVI